MRLSLPPDVLLLICEELGNRQDFRTLFNCALTNKNLVGQALSWLYRIHDQSNKISTEGGKVSVHKWALQWRSIIRSSLGTTAYPYCLYIRSLDLRDLSELLEDPLFLGNAEDTPENTRPDTALVAFFADDMAMFRRELEPYARNEVLHIRLNVPLILDLIGESITDFGSKAAGQNNATVALEDLAGDISATALPRWTGRLSRLKSMTLWDGDGLNENVAISIANNCPNFDDLSFYMCRRPEADQDLALFFSGLRSNSLQSFSVIGYSTIGPKTLLALNNHSKSLKSLKLAGLRTGSVQHLSLLQGCDALETLELQDVQGRIDLEANENDVFVDLEEWLGRCDRLQELLLANFPSAPAILTPLCLRNNIRLRKLQVLTYTLIGNIEFHMALSHQTSLESLELRAEADGASPDDIDTLVSSICQLTKLKDLNLSDTSDYFRGPEIQRLASHLPNLEEFSFGGYDVADDVWFSISGLHHLRVLNIHALTTFTVDGLLNYISSLQETNEGLLLAVMCQSGEHDLTRRGSSLIQKALTAKVNGRFEFILYRDMEGSDFDSLSD